MAEYFPLIERAIANLPDATAEARRSIYERARGALIGQLRKTEPPIPEEDIARESAALDEAIARAEAKFAGGTAGSAAPIEAPAATDRATGARTPQPARAAAGGAPPPRDASPLPGSTPRPAPAAPSAGVTPPTAASRRAGNAPGLPTAKAPPVAPPPGRERPVVGPAPPVTGELRPPIVPARPLATPRGARPTLPPRPGAADAAPERLAAEPEAGAAAKPAMPPATDLAVTASDAMPATDADAASSGGAGAAASEPPGRSRETALRPLASRPDAPRRFGWPVAVGAVLVTVVMIGVGVMAWTWRDRPEALAAAHPLAAAPVAQPPGKIVGRASSPGDGDADGSDTGSPSGVSVPPPVGQNAGGEAAPAIPVAQRAALLVDAPDDPQKIRTYSGTVVWHLDSVSPGQGLPLTPAIKADIDIPDAKLKVTMVMQKNLEPQLPASHTIEIHFFPQPGYALGNVIQINVPDMRKDDDAPSGDALAGVPVMIDPNSFLVGLSRGGAEAQNRRLIVERNWFDVSVLFAPRRPAKLTFEKGVDGEHLWEQAFAAWDAKGTAGASP